MSVRQVAGLEPMQPAIKLHGCHRVGNRVTGLDPTSPEALAPPLVIKAFGVSPSLRLRVDLETIRRLHDQLMESMSCT